MLNITLSTWWGAGHGVALWRYFGAELDTIPLILLFLIFFASDAGQTWGVDGVPARAALKLALRCHFRYPCARVFSGK